MNKSLVGHPVAYTHGNIHAYRYALNMNTPACCSHYDYNVMIVVMVTLSILLLSMLHKGTGHAIPTFGHHHQSGALSDLTPLRCKPQTRAR